MFSQISHPDFEQSFRVKRCGLYASVKGTLYTGYYKFIIPLLVNRLIKKLCVWGGGGGAILNNFEWGQCSQELETIITLTSKKLHSFWYPNLDLKSPSLYKTANNYGRAIWSHWAKHTMWIMELCPIFIVAPEIGKDISKLLMRLLILVEDKAPVIFSNSPKQDTLLQSSQWYSTVVQVI